MAKGEKGTTTPAGTPVPKWPRPRSGKRPDNTRKDITTKANLLGQCINACFAAMRQYDGTTVRYNEIYDELGENYWNALNHRSEIHALMDELRDLSPEEQAAFEQLNAAVDNLSEVRFDFIRLPEVVANELRADAKCKEEARCKAEETAKLEAETKARATAEAEEEAKLKADEEAKREAENEARLTAERESKLKAAIERIEVEAKAAEEANLKAKAEAKLKAEEKARLKAEKDAKSRSKTAKTKAKGEDGHSRSPV